MQETSSGLSRWPLGYFWLALSLMLNITGIASIVDGAVQWAGFFGNIIDVYRITVRDPLASVVHAVWPAAWPPIPRWSFDILVVWAAFFLAKNIANTKVFGSTIIGYRFAKHSPPVALGYCIWEFIATPFKTISIVGRRNDPKVQPSIQDIPEGATVFAEAYVGEHPLLGKKVVSRVEYYRLAALYLLFLICAFVVLLFINYQIRQR